MTTTALVVVVVLAVIAVAGIVALVSLRKRRTASLRTQFGEPEYARAVEATGSRKDAEARLDARKVRVEGFHIRPLAPADQVRFAESWRKVQARFVDSPGGAVTEADQLLGEVMSTRGYPVTNFEQRVADISVDHPSALTHYRAAHEIALGQAQGKAGTEDLRQAMIHYRTLFEELVGEREMTHAKTA
jgi:hypothetical protein